MAFDFSSKLTRVLYQNRFCEQEELDVIVSWTTDVFKHSEKRTSLRICLPNFDKIETIYFSKRHHYCERTVCERSNVWTIYSRLLNLGESQLPDKYKIIDSCRIYLGKSD